MGVTFGRPKGESVRPPRPARSSASLPMTSEHTQSTSPVSDQSAPRSISVLPPPSSGEPLLQSQPSSSGSSAPTEPSTSTPAKPSSSTPTKPLTSTPTNPSIAAEPSTAAEPLTTEKAPTVPLLSSSFSSKTTKRSYDPSFQNEHHQAASAYLISAKNTGRFGESGEREENLKNNFILRNLWSTFPWVTLIVQALWTGAVVASSYALSRYAMKKDNVLSEMFWSSKLNVSPTVASGVGWALFVLLAFFIREASNRYVDAQFAIHRTSALIRRMACTIRQCYPRGTWHPNDVDRILAHLVAYPIALKMTLRGERDPAQLLPILQADDVMDIVTADEPYVHCLRVVRSYISAAEDDVVDTFALLNAEKSPAGSVTRVYIILSLDDIDNAARKAVRIARFRPAVAYVNHLRIFLYIWLMFLPLTLVRTSGYFTFLWSLLVTYGVCMIFNHAYALNEPFGFDLQDIKLNHMCAEMAHTILLDSFAARVELDDVIDKDYDTPMWLESDQSEESNNLEKQTSKKKLRLSISMRWPVFIGLLVLIGWSALIIFLTWRYRDNLDDEELKQNWWYIYIPLSTGTTTYISLGVFILLGFWVNDAYGRYWHALQLWQTGIKPKVSQFAFELAVSCRRGVLHERDRERLMSYLAAFPYVAMLHLRGSSDVTVLNEILSTTDLAALKETTNYPVHVVNVICGYLHAIDKHEMPELFGFTSRYGRIMLSAQIRLSRLETTFAECEAIKMFPISPTFTVHLRLFAGLWLALLPFTLVRSHGFLSFVYLILIGYSIINLLCVGQELADPFGDDAEDLPLEEFCDEIKSLVKDVYLNLKDGSRHYVRPAPYDRSALTPGDSRVPAHFSLRNEHQTTLLQTLKSFFNGLPNTPTIFMICAILWNITAVLVSWGLSKVSAWGKRNEQCPKWCSPTDIDPSVLATVGFALFMILAFRASDAIRRYDDGAKLLTKLEMRIKALVLAGVESYPSNTFHVQDKERIVAHLSQLPLCIRDILIGKQASEELDKDGILSDEDRALLEASLDPLIHILNTVESYFLAEDIPNPRDAPDAKNASLPVRIVIYIGTHFDELHTLITKIKCIKRFPVARSYRRHQYTFAAVWLILLPFSMTPQTGFFTILWASLIAYGVLAMEEIATKLVDPYGTDAIDLPVREMCENASSSILETALSVDWNCHRDTRRSDIDEQGNLGLVISGTNVLPKYVTASLAMPDERQHEHNDNESDIDLEAQPLYSFSGPCNTKAKPTFFAHVLRSVPWWTLLAVTAWTAVACIISYITKTQPHIQTRWWSSLISIDNSVATYVSIAAFALLSFYVSASYGRYVVAGEVWGDQLRGNLHALAVGMLTLSPRDQVHIGDHRRVIGHIAAIPLALKAELRHSRDIREIKNLVSSSDLARMQCAPSMSIYCLNVVRAYFYKVVTQGVTAANPRLGPDRSMQLVNGELSTVEGSLHDALHLNTFDIAPGFLSLLNVLLGIWFIILPFVIAESSGWFTILWVPIVSYGLLGMHSLAAELQHPFGNDLNDLDIDRMANEVVADILDAYRVQPDGCVSLIKETPNPSEVWSDETTAIFAEASASKFTLQDDLSKFQYFKQCVLLATRPVPWWILLMVAVWSTFVVYISFLLKDKIWESTVTPNCKSAWFCSPIAIGDNLKEFIGFALFLLLAFRLTDSHSRYVRGLQLWEENLIGSTRLMSSRTFPNYDHGTFHRGDLERVAGHLLASAVCLMGALRDKDYASVIEYVLGRTDMQRILSTVDRSNYCNDVVRSYLNYGDVVKASGVNHLSPFNDVTWLLSYIQVLERAAIACRAMARTPMPFGYVQHLRIFLTIWLLLLPFGLVETSGWLTILWVVIISYGIIGIERWAEELSDPFGDDLSDVPLEYLCNRVFQAIKFDLKLYKYGAKTMLKNREPFPFVNLDKGNDDTGQKIVDNNEGNGQTEHLEKKLTAAVPRSGMKLFNK